MQQPEVKENVIFKTKIKQIAKPGKKREGGLQTAYAHTNNKSVDALEPCHIFNTFFENVICPY